MHVTNMDFRTQNLSVLNSITKYPPIPTLHRIGDKGVPTDEVLVDFSGETVEVTEKIDGTNARILLAGYQYIIGSRENLLTVSGDILFDPAQDIVHGCSNTAEKLVEDTWSPFTVLYGEVYGGKVSSNSKQYTTNRDLMDWRVFDAITFTNEELLRLSNMTPADRASWREGPRQDFMHTQERLDLCSRCDLTAVPSAVRTELPPTDRRHVLEWLSDTIPNSTACLDMTGAGRPEGVVVRTNTRSKIAKIRFEDYKKVK